jgi:ATP-dependent Clp protease adaptor protein ClpS
MDSFFCEIACGKNGLKYIKSYLCFAMKENIQFELLEEVETIGLETYSLVVFNDDVNTFDHVINTLQNVCEHSPEQAEQCTLLIHYKGKCAVKSGGWDKMAAMRHKICEAGLSAEVLD